MRIAYPERIPFQWAAVFAIALLCAQLVEHTDVAFALCNFGFVLTATLAFNLAGGLYRPVGAYIFFNATLTLIVALVVKAFLGEAANGNLLNPLLTAEVYLVGMLSMLVAAYVETRYRKHPPLISKIFPLTDLRAAFIGSVILGLMADLYFHFVPTPDAGTVASAFRNANSFLPFSIVLGVLYTVRSTNGRRSLTLPMVVLMIYMSFEGMFVFSKQGTFTPWFCWAVGAGLSRYKIKPLNIAVFFFMAALGGLILVPFIQYGKSDETRSQEPFKNLAMGFDMLQHIDVVRRDYKNVAEEDRNSMSFFDHSQGLFDRLQMVGPDDALIDVTERQGTFGYEPIKETFENLIPHVIWAGKPTPAFGNVYAHQMGTLSEGDTTTGISFGVTADAYHQGGWMGVIFAETACMMLVFTVLSRALGDVRDHPAVIVGIIVVAHVAPEGSFGGLIMLIMNTFIVLVLAFTCRFILPVFASVFEARKRPEMTSPATAFLPH